MPFFGWRKVLMNWWRSSDSGRAAASHFGCMFCVICATIFAFGGTSHGALLYVDADKSTNAGPASAFPGGTNDQADDNLWSRRTGFASGSSVYQSGDGNGEDSPEISTTITGLVPNTLYTAYVHFWDGSGDPPDWNVRGGLASGSLTLFANPADAADIGAQDAVLASSLTYSTPPSVFTEADRTMYAGLLGNGTSDASGQLTIYVDDRPSTIGGNHRSWYGGVSSA